MWLICVYGTIYCLEIIKITKIKTRVVHNRQRELEEYYSFNHWELDICSRLQMRRCHISMFILSLLRHFCLALSTDLICIFSSFFARGILWNSTFAQLNTFIYAQQNRRSAHLDSLKWCTCHNKTSRMK